MWRALRLVSRRSLEATPAPLRSLPSCIYSVLTSLFAFHKVHGSRDLLTFAFLETVSLLSTPHCDDGLGSVVPPPTLSESPRLHQRRRVPPSFCKSVQTSGDKSTSEMFEKVIRDLEHDRGGSGVRSWLPFPLFYVFSFCVFF